MKTWFIADTHFGHERILQYESRPFTSVDHMNKVLIENWNRVVADEDVVWHLGDVAMIPKPQIISILGQLKGNKFLVCGNHDKRITCTWWENHGFEVAVKFPHTVDVEHAVFSHIPIPNTTKLNIHGHMHANQHRVMPPGDPDLYRCVSVEQINFTPMSLEDVVGYNKGSANDN